MQTLLQETALNKHFHPAMVAPSPTPQSLRMFSFVHFMGWQTGKAVFLEKGVYYSVSLRFLLPGEIQQKNLAMFGSQELNYTGVTITEGLVPVPTPTP